MKKLLLSIIFIATLLVGHFLYIPETEYLIGAPDDTIELHNTTPVIYEA